MAGLYAAVAYELAQRSLAESGEDLQTAALGPDLVMRSRLVAWCLANGADPELFMTSRESLGGQALLARQAAFAPVSSRANDAFTEIVRFAFEGFAVLGPTHAYSERQMTDAIAMIQALRRRLPDVERDLGWETGELDTQSDRPRD
jgi:phage-related baseplate assembly protein